MLSLRRRQLLQSLVGYAGLSSLSTLGCSSSSEDEESFDELNLADLDARAAALLKVKKIVIVMMENRSFDHYFGHLTLPKKAGYKKGDPGEGVSKYTYAGGKPRQVEGDRSVNGFVGNEWNPRTPGGNQADGVKIFYAHDQQLGFGMGDINHEWVECHNQWNPVRGAPDKVPTKGQMNGFVIEHLRDRGELTPRDLGPGWGGAMCEDGNILAQICGEGIPSGGSLTCGFAESNVELKLAACASPDAPMSYYARKDTPVYHDFYDNFVLCDNWYSSVCGPTWPNRYYVHSGTASAAIGTEIKRDKRGDVDTIFKVLLKSNIPFYNFFSDAPLVSVMYGGDAHQWRDGESGTAKVFAGASPTDRLFFEAAKTQKPTPLVAGLRTVTSIAAKDMSFEERCQKGKLPPVSYIEPPYFCGDDHAPHDIRMGQAFVKSIYNMIYKGDQAQAAGTLLVVIYDEHGSLYDHQDPGLAFASSSGIADADPTFQPLGFRVPAMIVGPMVKRAHVSHTVYDHSSVLRTLYNWALLHAENKTGVLPQVEDRASRARPEAIGVQTQAMIEEMYKAGFHRDHPLRPLHATSHASRRLNAQGKIVNAQLNPDLEKGTVPLVHKPMLRVLKANDISDCLNPNYEPGRASMPDVSQVTAEEGRVLAGLQFSHGQESAAEAFIGGPPSYRAKVDAARVVMDHMYRLGAINIG